MNDTDGSTVSPTQKAVQRGLGMLMGVGIIVISGLFLKLTEAPDTPTAPGEPDRPVLLVLVLALGAAYITLTYIIESRGGSNVR